MEKEAPGSAPDGDQFGHHDPLAALVDSANAGDRASFRKLLEAVAPAVHRTVSLVLGHLHPDVPDVEQECMMALRTAFRTFRGESSVTQFVRQVALRRAVSARRQRQLHERHIDRLRRELRDDAEVDPSGDPLLRAHRAAAFQALLEGLPRSQAETFRMRVVMDYTLPQVARATGVPVNTVRSRIRLATEKLRQRIEAEPTLYENLIEGD
ncbi:MAG TPA: RNA polymerase sigma factor [Polyangia bacterium]|nr:RNA polymerase sigma factor [Polyangia bacterium]